MTKVGRNNLCPCGSGKKYKRCCMAQDEATAREAREARASAASAAVSPLSAHLCEDCNHDLDDAANAVFALIEAKQFDEAERGAHDVLARFPNVHDGYECLGRLHQAKGDHRQAIECYRKVIAFALEEPQYYDPEFVDHFQALIAHIEIQASSG